MYVTLPSHASRQEFPDNQANAFKIRLPEPLRLTGNDWQVGLSSISLPDTGLNLGHIVPAKQDIFSSSWARKKKDNSLDFKVKNMTMEDVITPVVDGVHFMKTFIRWYQQQVAEDFQHDYEAVKKHNNKDTVLVFKWEGDDLVLDFTTVIRQRFRGVNWAELPHFAFNVVFGEKMGWMKKNKSGAWELGPYLQMQYDQVPRKGQYDFLDAKGQPLFYKTTTDSKKVTWLWMSGRLNWKFTSLNVGFRNMVKDPVRSLHIYSDVGVSTVVGNRTVDLLREIKYQRQGTGQVYFEPQHIQYHPVTTPLLEMVEVHVAETSGEGGDLVQFQPGHTLITLHFKKKTP